MASELAKSPEPNVNAPRARNLRKKFGAWAPTLLLAMALSTLFLFNIDRERFYAPIRHDTAKNLAIAENLSPQHNFRMFTRLGFDQDGEPTYAPYNRFPIGGFALIKLTILPFGDNLAAKVFAARMLMLAFLCAAAFLAHRAIARIASNEWIALAAVTIAFSSYYILRYGAWVSTEFMIDLFAVMLTFHGMVIFVQEGRFRQLMIKAFIALLLGWHVYAFLAPFVVLGFIGEIIQTIKRRGNAVGASDGEKASGSKSVGSSILRPIIHSRYMRLGGATLLFGAAILAFNVISEYDALNGETPITDLPSVRSFLGRTGLGEESNADRLRAWGLFAARQFHRATGASIPSAFIDWPGDVAERPPYSPPLLPVAAGILAGAAAIAGSLLVRRRRILLATLALSGFCWALLARGNTSVHHHQYEAIYYVSVPLALVTLLLIGAAKLGGSRILPVVAAAAALAFVFSAFQSIARGPELERDAERHKAVLSDLTEIRKITRGKNVLVAQGDRERLALYGDRNPLDFHLAGSRINYDAANSPPVHDFVLATHRDERLPLLTPLNKIVFLYAQTAPADLHRSRLDSIAARASGEPDARAVYDVSIADRALIYLKEPCVYSDVEHQFFLHIYPERADDLPAWRRPSGYDNLDFLFWLRGVRFDGKCAAQVPLPEYPIAGVRTGQFIRGASELWDAAFPFDSDVYRAAHRAVVSREPDARADFDFYLDEAGRVLTYVKDPCSASDVERPFFLHVAPENADDLQEDQRELGFDSLDFDFRLRGALFDGKCAAQVPLPEYPIAGVRTGQLSRDSGELWDAAFPFDPNVYRAAHQAVVSRQPDARAEFDLYLDEAGRALIYVKDPCSTSDVETPFFLHVTPQRAGDLPQERRDLGFDNLDFDFRLRGALFDGKCAAQVPLPEYGVASIRTGQWEPGAGEVWSATIPSGGARRADGVD